MAECRVIIGQDGSGVWLVCSTHGRLMTDLPLEPTPEDLLKATEDHRGAMKLQDGPPRGPKPFFMGGPWDGEQHEVKMPLPDLVRVMVPPVTELAICGTGPLTPSAPMPETVTYRLERMSARPDFASACPTYVMDSRLIERVVDEKAVLKAITWVIYVAEGALQDPHYEWLFGPGADRR